MAAYDGGDAVGAALIGHIGYVDAQGILHSGDSQGGGGAGAGFTHNDLAGMLFRIGYEFLQGGVVLIVANDKNEGIHQGAGQGREVVQGEIGVALDDIDNKVGVDHAKGVSVSCRIGHLGQPD